MLCRKKGQGVIEFVLVMPVVMAMFFCLVDLTLVGVQRMVLGHRASQVARLLALSKIESASELETEGNRIFSQLTVIPTEILVSLRDFPSTQSKNKLRSKKVAQVIEFSVAQPAQLRFPLFKAWRDSGQWKVKAVIFESRIKKVSV